MSPPVPPSLRAPHALPSCSRSSPASIAGVAAALAVFEAAAEQDGAEVSVDVKVADGGAVRPGDRVALVRGAAATILRAERPAVNLVSHLSGSRDAHAGVRGCGRARRDPVHAEDPARPSGRRARGGRSRAAARLHRASLSDAVLIKDNHVRIAGGVGPRGSPRVRRGAPDRGRGRDARAARRGGRRRAPSGSSWTTRRPSWSRQAIERLGGPGPARGLRRRDARARWRRSCAPAPGRSRSADSPTRRRRSTCPWM